MWYNGLMKKDLVKFNSLGQWSFKKDEPSSTVPETQGPASDFKATSAQQAKTNKLLEINKPKFVESVVTKPKKRQQDRRGTSPIQIDPPIERRTSDNNRRGSK